MRILWVNEFDGKRKTPIRQQAFAATPPSFHQRFYAGGGKCVVLCHILIYRYALICKSDVCVCECFEWTRAQNQNFKVSTLAFALFCICICSYVSTECALCFLSVCLFVVRCCCSVVSSIADDEQTRTRFKKNASALHPAYLSIYWLDSKRDYVKFANILQHIFFKRRFRVRLPTLCDMISRRNLIVWLSNIQIAMHFTRIESG